MHIRKLTLDQFRGASHVEINMHARLNVFVGMNGHGKSSILDAVSILLSWPANRIKSSNASGRPIVEDDIRNVSNASMLEIEVMSEATQETYKWNLRKNRRGSTSKQHGSELGEASKLSSSISSMIQSQNGRVNIPLFSYYPVNRAVLDIPLRIRGKHQFDLLSSYSESLLGGADFRTFFEWFREREDLENEIRRDMALYPQMNRQMDRLDEYPDPQLTAVRTALTRFMPGFSNLTVRRSPLRMEVEKAGMRLKVNQLSDGEKCLMALVGDLARRLAIANPVLDNPLEGHGVVLIDEIDLHLHPKWQSMVISKLLGVFPNCQFLVSTHSPHVITHVWPESLFLLDSDENGLRIATVEESYGKTAERILTEMMGLDSSRPAEVNQKLKRLYVTIGNNELEDAKKQMDQLTELIGEDADLSSAKTLIMRKELIGK